MELREVGAETFGCHKDVCVLGTAVSWGEPANCVVSVLGHALTAANKGVQLNVSKIHQHESTTGGSALAHSTPKLLMQAVLKTASKEKT